jgi:hypothetical protein
MTGKVDFQADRTVNADRAAADPEAAHALWGARRGELLAWLARAPGNVPEVHGQLAAMEDFERAWRAAWLSKPIDRLSGAKADLSAAEGLAAAHGYVVPSFTVADAGGAYRTDPAAPEGAGSPGPTSPAEAGRSGPQVVVAPPPSPSIAVLHPTAQAINDLAPDLPGAGHKQDAGPRGDQTDGRDPYLNLKVAAVGGLALAGLAGAAVLPGTGARAAAAGGGVLAAALAAAAFFWPKSAAEKVEASIAGAKGDGKKP